MNQRYKNKRQKPKIKQIMDASLPKAKFELSDKQIETLKNIKEIILGVGAIFGIATLTITAPNVLQLINKAAWARKTYRSLASKNRDQKNKINQAFYYLKRQGYIKLIPKNDDFLMKITQKGEEKISQMNLRNLTIKHKAQWDGSWWVVIGDIPTELRSQAHSFRQKLKQLGLYTLQRSVWLYPYNPRDEIAFIAKLNGLERYITTFRALDLEQEDLSVLKKFYHLK